MLPFRFVASNSIRNWTVVKRVFVTDTSLTQRKLIATGWITALSRLPADTKDRGRPSALCPRILRSGCQFGVHAELVVAATNVTGRKTDGRFTGKLTFSKESRVSFPCLSPRRPKATFGIH